MVNGTVIIDKAICQIPIDVTLIVLNEEDGGKQRVGVVVSNVMRVFLAC